MADDDDFEEGSASDDMMQGASGKKGGKKGMIIILLVVLLLVGIVIGLYSLGIVDKLLGGGEAPPADAAAPQTSAQPVPTGTAGQPGGVQPAVFMDLPPMKVNLNTTGPKQVFLMISVSLELANAADMQKVEQMMPRVRDIFNVYLRELRPEELKGSAGSYRLREELITRINHVLQPIRINDVLFKEMLVQ